MAPGGGVGAAERYHRIDDDAPEPGEPESAAAPLRFTSRRVGAAALLAAFALALLSPFYFSTRARYILSPVPAIRAALPPAAKAARAVPQERLDSAERIVRAEVRRGGFPGAALSVGVGPVPLLEEGVGRTRWGRLAPPVDPEETLYD